MKVSLKDHLHTPKCMELVRQYERCHAENKFLKFVGACNQVDAAAERCVQEELRMKSAMNRTTGCRRPNKIKKEFESLDTRSESKKE